MNLARYFLITFTRKSEQYQHYEYYINETSINVPEGTIISNPKPAKVSWTGTEV